MLFITIIVNKQIPVGLLVMENVLMNVIATCSPNKSRTRSNHYFLPIVFDLLFWSKMQREKKKHTIEKHRQPQD